MSPSKEELLRNGEALLHGGDSIGAIAAFERAVAAFEREVGPTSKALLLPLASLAKAYRAHRYKPCAELDRAVSIGERCIAIAEAEPVDDEDLASMLHFNGITLWLNGQHAASVATLRRALSVAERVSPDTRTYLEPLVEVLLDYGRPSEALVHVQALVEQDKQIAGVGADYSLYLLGDCLRQAGETEAARAVLEELVARGSSPQMEQIVRGWLTDL